MATPLNTKRIVLGGLVGGVCWNIWSMIVNMVFLAEQYQAGQDAGHILKEPRYSYFLVVWVVALLLLGIAVAWLYAAARTTLGPGPGTALKVGLVVGLVATFPMSFSQSSWSALPRIVPLWWMLDSLVGILLASLVAGWMYREN